DLDRDRGAALGVGGGSRRTRAAQAPRSLGPLERRIADGRARLARRARDHRAAGRGRRARAGAAVRVRGPRGRSGALSPDVGARRLRPLARARRRHHGAHLRVRRRSLAARYLAHRSALARGAEHRVRPRADRRRRGGPLPRGGRPPHRRARAPRRDPRAGPGPAPPAPLGAVDAARHRRWPHPHRFAGDARTRAGRARHRGDPHPRAEPRVRDAPRGAPRGAPVVARRRGERPGAARARGAAAPRRLVREALRRAHRRGTGHRSAGDTRGSRGARAGAPPPQRGRARGVRRGALAVGQDMTGPSPILHPDDDPRLEIALQLASRFWQLVKSARAYSVGHVTYTSQLESYLTLLSTALEKEGAVRFDAPEGELCMNGEQLPDRAHMQKALESLAQEFAARTLEGIEFTRGLSLGELETFMSYFLPGERWKGAELVAACDDAGLVHARALPLRVAAEPLGAGPLPESSAEAAANLPPAWRALLAGARALLEGDAMDQGIELRHVKRMLRELIDAVLAGERLV